MDAECGRGGEPTPAELRELQSRADALAHDIAAMRSRVKAHPYLPDGVRGAFPEAADGALGRTAERLGAAADAMARVRAARWVGSCTAWWGICPHCSLALRTEDDRSWCTGCGAAWGYDRSKGPCAEPGAFLAMDVMGGTVLVCAGHGRYLSDRLEGGLLLAIPEP